VLPIAAIIKTDKGDMVYKAVKEEKKIIAKLIPVTLGISYGKMVEIKDGISIGDKIVTTGQRALNNGEEINFGK
jgi:multidrug efflux system membrane fusion protein